MSSAIQRDALKVFSRSKRSVALGLPQRTARGARQADRELFAQAPDQFIDTTHFDTVRFPPPDWALQSFSQAATDGSLAYTSYRGHGSVLESVSAALANFTGARFDPSTELILAPGTQGGLFSTLSAMIDEGDQVLLVDPDYLFSERILRFLGAHVLSVPLSEGPVIQPDLQVLEKLLIQYNPKLLLFSHSNNPTGAVYSPAVIGSIAELAIKHDIWVVVDELYARLIYDGVPFSHLVTQPSMRERTVTLFGPSKTESLSGTTLKVTSSILFAEGVQWQHAMRS